MKLSKIKIFRDVPWEDRPRKVPQWYSALVVFALYLGGMFVGYGDEWGWGYLIGFVLTVIGGVMLSQYSIVIHRLRADIDYLKLGTSKTSTNYKHALEVMDLTFEIERLSRETQRLQIELDEERKSHEKTMDALYDEESRARGRHPAGKKTHNPSIRLLKPLTDDQKDD